MTLKKEIGRKIRLIRGNLKLTQVELARELKVAPATVSAWELGDIGISLEAVIRLAEYAGVSLDWLLRGSTETFSVQISDTLAPEEIRMLAAFRNAKRSDQQALIRFGESVTKSDV